MLPVVLSLLALCIGPLFGPLLQRFRGVASAFDGFVVVTVCGLVVLHVLPQSVELGGAAVLVLAAVGVAVPALLHRLDARQTSRAVRGGRDVVTVVVVAFAAFAHAVLDGMALVDEHGHEAAHAGDSISVLAVAVLLHRLPYGLALWTVGRERLGLGRTLLILGCLAAGTITGAVVGEQLVTSTTAAGFAFVQAFAAGAILHVLLDAPPVDVSGAPRWSLLGVAAGVGVLVVLAQSHPFLATVAGELDFGATLWTLSTTLAPALTLALVISALVARRPQRLRVGDSVLVDVGSGVVAGALRGLCNCTVVPLFDGLVRRRARVAAAVAFLVGAPEVSSISLLVSGQLLGVVFAAVRVGAAVVLAVVVGLAVDAAAAGARDGDAEVVDVDVERGFVKALLKTFDHTAPWLLAGVVVAAFLEPLLTRDALAGIPRALEVPLYAVVGVPFYVCGTGAAPIAAVLVHKGASVGAVTALWLAAPATNLATLGLLTRALSRTAAVVFGLSIFVVACSAGFVVNAFAGDVAVPDVHAAADVSVVEVACAAFLFGLLVYSVARQGARGFLGQILHPLDDAKGGHVHGPHCGHAEHKSPGFLKRAPVASVKIDFTP